MCSLQFWFSNYNGFSGQKWFVEYGNQTYNLLYTALPLLLMGIYDRDVWDTTALKYPMLYEHGRTGEEWRALGPACSCLLCHRPTLPAC